jgi:hypothetical protein
MNAFVYSAASLGSGLEVFVSKYIQDYSSTLMRFDEPFGYVTLTDFGEGMGLLQIHSDYGSYSFYWGAMGKRTILEFLANCSAEYVHTKLQSCVNYQSMKIEAKRRLQKFMINCWPDIHAELKAKANCVVEKDVAHE